MGGCLVIWVLPKMSWRTQSTSTDAEVLMSAICLLEQERQGQVKDARFGSNLGSTTSRGHGATQGDSNRSGKAIDISASLQMKHMAKIKEEGEAGVGPGPGSAHPHVLMHGGGHGRPAEKSISGGRCQDFWTTRRHCRRPSILSSPSSTLPKSCPAVFFFLFFLSAEERGGWGMRWGRRGQGGVCAAGGLRGGGLLFAYV